MKLLLLGALVVGCASAPRPKAPDESHRIPVNRTVPAEVARPDRPERPAARDLVRGDGVEWR
jgi:hypothetical protein